MIIGELLGDNLSYFFGKIFKNKIKNKYREKGEVYFKRYGVLSLVLSKFIGIFRPLIPVTLGIFNYNFTRFFIINVISVIAFVYSHLLLGFLFGEIFILIFILL